MEQTPNFEAPIPGQSLTSEPKLYPWETPPEIDKVSDAIAFYIRRISSPEVVDDLFMALEEGFPLNILVKSMLTTGVMEGMHTVDVSLVIAPVIHEYILGIATLDGVNDKERPMTKAQMLEKKENARLASAIERSLEKAKDQDEGSDLLEEALSFVQNVEKEPEEEPVEEESMPEEQPKGLMSRREV